MPRRQRNYLPGLPCHSVRRGNNRSICFRAESDYQVYLDLWRTKSLRYGVAVHAYCLMTNYVHFLVTAEDPTSIYNTMKVVGSQYACYVNRVYRRTGTLWEGGHRSRLVDADNYLLICQRYIDLNPVRAQMVSHAADYPWSSYGCNALGDSSWVSPHPVFLLLAREAKQCCAAYLAFNPETIQIIRTATHFSQPIGAEAFRRGIEQRFGLRRGYSSPGRPPAVANADSG